MDINWLIFSCPTIWIPRFKLKYNTCYLVILQQIFYLNFKGPTSNYCSPYSIIISEWIHFRGMLILLARVLRNQFERINFIANYRNAAKMVLFNCFSSWCKMSMLNINISIRRLMVQNVEIMKFKLENWLNFMV